MNKSELESRFKLIDIEKPKKKSSKGIQVPTVSLYGKNGLYFSADAVKLMGAPEKVLVRIDPQGKEMAIVPTESDNEKGVVFLDSDRKVGNPRQLIVRWTRKALINPIYQMTGLDFDKKYTFPISYDPDCEAFFINFNEQQNIEKWDKVDLQNNQH